MRKQTGVSLLELLILVLLLAIVLNFASGFFISMLETYRQKIALNELEKVLTLARSLANTRNSTIWICPANADFSDCADNHQTKYFANWLIKDTNTDKIIYKSPQKDFIFFKTNKPANAIIINPYHSSSANSSVLICTGFTKIKPKAILIGIKGNYRYASSGASFNKLVNSCQNL